MPNMALSHMYLCGLTLPFLGPTGRVPGTSPCQVFITECLIVGRTRETKGPVQHWELDTTRYYKGECVVILDDSQASLHHGVRGREWGTGYGSWGRPCDRKLL